VSVQVTFWVADESPEHFNFSRIEDPFGHWEIGKPLGPWPPGRPTDH